VLATVASRNQLHNGFYLAWARVWTDGMGDGPERPARDARWPGIARAKGLLMPVGYVEQIKGTDAALAFAVAAA